MYRFESIEIDTDRLEIRSQGKPVSVEPQVFSLLLYLIENRDRVISKDELIASIWNGRIVSDATLNSRMNSLRRVVGDTGKAQQVIRTYPRRGFRFVAVLEHEEPNEPVSSEPQAVWERPSIAVLPFRYLAEDSDQAYLATGVTEEIITALSRLRWLFVISQTSSFSYGSDHPDWRTVSEELGVDYVLTGSIRKSGGDLRVSAQLTKTDTAHQVWAERFSGQLGDVFKLHDEIVFAIVSHMEPEITRAEIDQLRRERRPGDLTAWEHYLRAIPHSGKLEREANEAARAELALAIQIDPDFVLPHVALAWCWALAALHGWYRSGSEALELSRLHARNALELDPGDARAYCAMAFAEFWVGNQKMAKEYARQSLQLDPNMTDAHGILGASQAVSGDPKDGTHALERALRGSPRDPIRWFWYHGLANAYFAMEDYNEASAWADKVVQTRPTIPQGYLMKAASLVFLGETEAAAYQVNGILEHSPHYTISRVLRNPMWTDEGAFERLLYAAKSAGLPP